MDGVRPAIPEWLAAAGLGLLASAILWVSTPHGTGVEYDSVFYWSAAENLLEGRGLGRVDGTGDFIPLTHFPPLYPLALGTVARIAGISVQAAARLLAAGLLGINLILIWRVLLDVGAGHWAAWSSALVCLVAPTIFERHLWTMSEPLYFGWLLLALGCLRRSLSEPGRRWLLGAAAASGLATLTRFAGASMLATGALAFMLLESRPWRARLGRAALFVGLGGLLPLLWQLRNLVVVGTPTNRSLLFHPPGAAQIREAGSTLAAWLPYPSLAAKLRFGLLVLAGLAALVVLIRQGRRRPEVRGTAAWRLVWLSALHMVSYVGMLGVSLTFFDASTRLRDRMLSPIFLSVVLATAAIFTVHRPIQARALRIAALIALCVLILPYSAATFDWLQASQDGLGFVGSAWRQSETMAQVRQLPANLQLFSNEAFPIYFLTRRPATSVPERFDPVRGTERDGYRLELEAMKARVDSGEAALVLFHPRSLRPELPPLAELADRRTPIWMGDDGWILLDRGG